MMLGAVQIVYGGDPVVTVDMLQDTVVLAIFRIQRLLQNLVYGTSNTIRWIKMSTLRWTVS